LKAEDAHLELVLNEGDSDDTGYSGSEMGGSEGDSDGSTVYETEVAGFIIAEGEGRTVQETMRMGASRRTQRGSRGPSWRGS
jgi:hypothetical protein